MLLPQPSTTLGFKSIWYGKGLVSLVVMGGMWSLSRLTIVMIFIAVFCKVELIAFMTFVRSTESVES